MTKLNVFPIFFLLTLACGKGMSAKYKCSHIFDSIEFTRSGNAYMKLGRVEAFGGVLDAREIGGIADQVAKYEVDGDRIVFLFSDGASEVATRKGNTLDLPLGPMAGIFGNSKSITCKLM